MDVVADGGAVGGGVVLTEDFDGFAAAEGDVEDERDEVGFRLVGLAATRNSSGHVEVAQAGVGEAVNLGRTQRSICSTSSLDSP